MGRQGERTGRGMEATECGSEGRRDQTGPIVCVKAPCECR